MRAIEEFHASGGDISGQKKRGATRLPFILPGKLPPEAPALSTRKTETLT
ncbi:hypothetical protein E0K89_001530 [Aquicoccus sp. SCR17]|nr:hypothetical protein [Carideicomes alvinocaridis]